MPTQSTRRLSLIFVLIIGWITVFIYFIIARFDPFIGDVQAYWGYSQALGEFNVFHLPAYSAVIGVLHFILPSAHPLLTMRAINMGSWVVASFTLYNILRQQKLPLVWMGTILFAIFPFYGVVSVVHPLADTPAAACVMVGLWAYFRNEKWLLVLAFGVGLLTHKLIWPFIALALLIGVLQKRISLWNVVLVCTPLSLYIVLGTGFHHDVLWLFRDSGVSATGYTRVLPILDAVFGPLFTGKVTDILQFLIVFPIFTLACVLLFNQSWKTEPILLALIIPIILIGVFFTEAYSQVPLRLGRMLIIPLVYSMSRHKVFTKLDLPPIKWGIIIVLITSQIAFAFYMTEFFFK